MSSDRKYMPGIGNHFCSEALPNALPKGQNNPQRCPYGLYAEQLTGTAFTKPRHSNMRSWLYRIRPSVVHTPLVEVPSENIQNDPKDLKVNPNQMRWMPVAIPGKENPMDFVQGLRTVGGAGNPLEKKGLSIYYYTANKDMGNKCLSNSDGDFLIVAQTGRLEVKTEFGIIDVEPCEICVIQRGMRFSINLPDGKARGYILEIFEKHFQLPDLGPIGSNGLANPQDFLTPVAAFEDVECDYLCVIKYGGKLFEHKQKFSPFNVVAYSGNYVPYKYDLRKFNCMNSVTYDHPDPSIYTVLTCPTDEPGVAAADFVIFPPRWMVMENTFRPPWYHRNTMSEYMGMIWGEYDAKQAAKDSEGKETGFVPGGGSLHSCMMPHGPDAGTFDKATNADLKPEFFDKGLAFMFETTYFLKMSDWSLNGAHLDKEYYKCWESLPSKFNPNERPPANGANHLMAWRKEKSSKSKL